MWKIRHTQFRNTPSHTTLPSGRPPPSPLRPLIGHYTSIARSFNLRIIELWLLPVTASVLPWLCGCSVLWSALLKCLLEMSECCVRTLCVWRVYLCVSLYLSFVLCAINRDSSEAHAMNQTHAIKDSHDTNDNNDDDHRQLLRTNSCVSVSIWPLSIISSCSQKRRAVLQVCTKQRWCSRLEFEFTAGSVVVCCCVSLLFACLSNHFHTC